MKRAIVIILGPALRPLAQLVSILVLGFSSIVILLSPFACWVSNIDRIRYMMAGAQLDSFAESLATYHRDCQAYPTAAHGLSVLVENPGLTCWNGPYLKSLPRDPWAHPYVYVFHGVSEPEVITYGGDGRPGGVYFATDVSSRNPRPVIPESFRETLSKWLPLLVWLGAWVAAIGSCFTYRWGSRRAGRRDPLHLTPTAGAGA